jgi:CRISPR-associated exonuclease Cas4
MESYILISFLNDFIFCPRSIYFHQLYGRMSTHVYHSSAQTKGQNAHKSIDSKTYTTSKDILQGIEVYSSRYNLAGKIDTYDQKKELLVERKKKIKVVYDGYIYQLYAQYFALTDMGYSVRKMKLYSMDDNKSYPVALPDDDLERKLQFEDLIDKINAFDLTHPFSPNASKCKHCIYNNLCDVTLC